MPKFLFWVMFITHGVFPLGFAIFLILHDDLFIAILSFLIAGIGFKDIYMDFYRQEK